MSDEQRLLSKKSRQDLLDEIYYLRDVAGEREQRVQERDTELESLRSQLELILRSRSWRMTSPLRQAARLIRRIVNSATSAHIQSPKVDNQANDPPPRPFAPTRAEDRRDGKPRLYVEVTELVLREGRTGVQRVTREILRAMLDAPATGYQIQPVYALSGQPYRLAQSFTSRLRGGGQALDDVRMAARSGDVFLGLDHSMRAVAEHAADLMDMHERGVRMWFVCNDVLPLSHPEWFPPEVSLIFKTWLETVARIADGIACISMATESELRQQLSRLDVPRAHPLMLAHFDLGADIRADKGGDAMISPEQASTIECLRTMTSFLMVGTVEPRKGHAQALQAFESLWADGSEAALVIAGFPGWMTDVLARRIRHHEEFGKRLFWFMGPDDAVLDSLYSTCTALLASSEGEGFGLPLVEAARYGLPILCRDLPVFREVAGEHATYFSGRAPVSLTIAIRDWLRAYERGTALRSTGVPRSTWSESAQQLFKILPRALESAETSRMSGEQQ